MRFLRVLDLRLVAARTVVVLRANMSRMTRADSVSALSLSVVESVR